MKQIHPFLASGWLVASMTAAFAQNAVTATSGAEPTVQVNRYLIEGQLPLSESDITTVLAPFQGDAKTIRDIESASKALENAVRNHGFSFYRIFVPAQKPQGGVITLKVIEYRVSQVEVSGNEHFNVDNIRRGIPGLIEGNSPNMHVIAEQLATSNNNPAKQVSINFRESAQTNSLDAIVRVRDSNPESYVVSYAANTSLSGVGVNGRDNTNRVSGVYQHSNVLDRDQVLTLSYTTDLENLGGVKLFGAYYQAPVYQAGLTLSGFLTYSELNSGTVQQGSGTFDVNGGGRFVGGRVSQSLGRWGSVQHSISLGVEQRHFNNSTSFNNVQVYPDVSSRTLNPQYNFRLDHDTGIFAGNLGFTRNIRGGSSNNSDSHAQNGGTRGWSAWRFSLESLWRKEQWQLTARLKGQYSGKALVSGEQFGLGGANSVRGFTDRAIAGDWGYQWGFEAVGPAFESVAVRPVLFTEGGWVKSNSTGASDTVMGAGTGIRYFNGNFQLSADIATALDKPAYEVRAYPWRLMISASHRF